jgi:hypothetical protein
VLQKFRLSAVEIRINEEHLGICETLAASCSTNFPSNGSAKAYQMSGEHISVIAASLLLLLGDRLTGSIFLHHTN